MEQDCMGKQVVESFMLDTVPLTTAINLKMQLMNGLTYRIKTHSVRINELGNYAVNVK